MPNFIEFQDVNTAKEVDEIAKLIWESRACCFTGSGGVFIKISGVEVVVGPYTATGEDRSRTAVFCRLIRGLQILESQEPIENYLVLSSYIKSNLFKMMPPLFPPIRGVTS